MDILDRVEKIANETPPVENSASRFGNPAFRTFYDAVAEVRRCASFLFRVARRKRLGSFETLDSSVFALYSSGSTTGRD